MLLVVQELITDVNFFKFKRTTQAWLTQYLTINRSRDGFCDKVVMAHHTLHPVISEKGTGFHSHCFSEMLFTSVFLSAQTKTMDLCLRF